MNGLMVSKRILTFVTGLFLAATITASSYATTDPIYKTEDGAALGDYDAVSYSQAGGPQKGKAELIHEWKGAKWYFANKENMEAFVKDPEKYAPQYGGYCAWALSQNAIAPGDPMLWKMVDGKLYLNLNKDVQKKWLADIPGLIEKANANWPAVLNK